MVRAVQFHLVLSHQRINDSGESLNNYCVLISRDSGILAKISIRSHQR